MAKPLNYDAKDFFLKLLRAETEEEVAEIIKKTRLLE